MSILRPKLTESETLRRHPAMGVLLAAGVTGACLVAEPWLGHRPALLVYLAALVLAGPMIDRAGVFIQAAVSALAWNFFFTHPRFTLYMNDGEDIALLALFGVVTLAVARLARSAREHEALTHGDEERRHSLYEITRELTSGAETEKTVTAALRRLGEAYEADVSIIRFGDGLDKPCAILGDCPGDDAISSARWALENRLAILRDSEIPEAGGVQQFVLPLANGGAVLHLRFLSGQPATADRVETLRLTANLFALVINGEGAQS